MSCGGSKHTNANAKTISEAVTTTNNILDTTPTTPTPAQFNRAQTAALAASLGLPDSDIEDLQHVAQHRSAVSAYKRGKKPSDLVDENAAVTSLYRASDRFEHTMRITGASQEDIDRTVSQFAAYIEDVKAGNVHITERELHALSDSVDVMFNRYIERRDNQNPPPIRVVPSPPPKGLSESEVIAWAADVMPPRHLWDETAPRPTDAKPKKMKPAVGQNGRPADVPPLTPVHDLDAIMEAASGDPANARTIQGPEHKSVRALIGMVGHNSTITRISRTPIDGIDAVRVIADPGFGRAKESAYLTPDGFTVYPMYGSYGSDQKWAVGHPQMRAAIKKMYGVNDFSLPAANLTEAADAIRRARAALASEQD